MQPVTPKKNNDYMLILIPSFILIVAWIIFHIYNNAVSSTITPTENSLISPISPNFDLSVLELLKQREDITPVSHVDILSPGDSTLGQEASTPSQTASSSSVPVSPIQPVQNTASSAAEEIP